MIQLCRFVAPLSCLWLALALGRSYAADEETGFTPLFDGKTLSGWKVKSEKGPADDTWSVKDGVLSAKPGANWLSTDKEYGDFVLRLQWRVPENGNSGVFVRVPTLGKGEHPHEKGIEIQVLDDKGSQFAGKLKAWQYSGSIYGAVPAENSPYVGPGEWHAYEITCRGETLEVRMNGRLVSRANVTEHETLKPRPRRGFVGLQNHGTAVDYKDIEIREIR